MRVVKAITVLKTTLVDSLFESDPSFGVSYFDHTFVKAFHHFIWA